MNFFLQCNRFRPTKQVYKINLKIYYEREMEEEILGKGVRPGTQALSTHLPEYEGGNSLPLDSCSVVCKQLRVQTSSQ